MLKLLLVLIPLVSTKMVYLKVRENMTQPCPNMKSDIIDRSSMKMSFDLISGGNAEDQATITDVNGNTRVISFPACYRAKLSFKLKTPIKNPYVEAFLQLGQNIPCESAGRAGIDSICANITQPNWCPKSENGQLREMLRDKKTCQFCHMCESIDWDTKEGKTARKYLTNEGSEKCDTEEEMQTLSFKMCTPSRSDMNEREDKERDQLQQYWHYLKQGVLTAVVHVLDRDEVEGKRKKQCIQMCDTYENRKGVSQSYKRSLLHSIERMCSPHDSYAACVYHTIKFDINGDF